MKFYTFHISLDLFAIALFWSFGYGCPCSLLYCPCCIVVVVVVVVLCLLLLFFSAGSETQAQGTSGKPSITELIYVSSLHCQILVSRFY